MADGLALYRGPGGSQQAQPNLLESAAAMNTHPGLDAVRVVLVGTTHSGNIGATARAMKTMGLRQLVLVNPQCTVDAQAEAMAAGGLDVLTDAVTRHTLADAVADCVQVVATSARSRGIGWAPLSPRAAAELLIQHAPQGPVAVVFGPERSGLANADLDLCQHRLAIPANPDFASLNLAAAVQVVAYELRCAALRPDAVPPARAGLAPQQELEALHEHLGRTLHGLGFADQAHPGKVLRRLRELVNRAAPNQNEINILRGILSAADSAVQRATNAPAAPCPSTRPVD